MSSFGIGRDQLDELRKHPALEDFVESFEALVTKRKDMIRRIEDLISYADKRKGDSNFVKFLGLAGVAGGALLSLTPLAPVGVGMASIGTTTIIGGSIYYRLTATDKKKCLEILKEGVGEMEVCLMMLSNFIDYAKELAKKNKFDFETANALLTSSIALFGMHAFTPTMKLGGKFLAAIVEARSCPQLEKHAAQRGLKSTITKVSLPADQLREIVVVGHGWYIGKGVVNIENVVELLQRSVREIPKLIFGFSEDFRKDGFPH